MLFTHVFPLFSELQQANEGKLWEFCDFLEMAFCKRCWLDSHKTGNRPYHTHGGVLELLAELDVTDDEIDRWIADLEHGFLHGFLVLYFAYQLHPSKNELWDSVFCYNEQKKRPERITHGDRLVISCLLHDFMRIRGSEPHDQSLTSLSGSLDPVTYTHSDPPATDIDHPLIGADRLELLRYPDSNEWCDPNVLRPYIQSYGEKQINHFFRHIRPVLMKMIAGREDIWISHVLEINWMPMEPIRDNKGVDFYPKSHWMPSDPAYAEALSPEATKYISVNFGKLPSTNCLAHTSVKDASRGMITLANLRKNGCELRAAPASITGRDHPFLVENAKIPTNEWMFLYININYMDMFDINDNLHCLNESLFNRIFHLVGEFLVKMRALSVKGG